MAGELAPAAAEGTSTLFDSSSNDFSEDAAASSESDPTIGRPASLDAEGGALEPPVTRYHKIAIATTNAMATHRFSEQG